MNDNEINPSGVQDAHGDDKKLAAEAARRRVQAREANERADAAEQTVADLKSQIAELRLSQAKRAVTAAHPELTPELIDEFAPDNIDADGLESWASKALGLVVALRGEAPEDAMTDAERELEEKKLEIARMEATQIDGRITDDVLDKLCGETTPEGVTAWAHAFSAVLRKWGARDVGDPSPMALMRAAIRANQIGGGKMKNPNAGLQGVAKKLTKR